MNGIKQVISQRHLEWIAIRLPMIHRLRFQLFQNLFIGYHQMFAHIVMVGPLTLTLSMSTPSVILPSITLSGLRSVLLMPACGFQWGNKTTSTIVSIATASTTTTTTVKITTKKQQTNNDSNSNNNSKNNDSNNNNNNSKNNDSNNKNSNSDRNNKNKNSNNRTDRPWATLPPPSHRLPKGTLCAHRVSCVPTSFGRWPAEHLFPLLDPPL